MISLKRYLDSLSAGSVADCDQAERSLISVALGAYASALLAMGSSSVDACPSLGSDLRQQLSQMSHRLTNGITCEALVETDREVRDQLQDWGRRTARHYQHKSEEVKDLLLVMAQTAESVSTRDQKCAGRFHDVTSQLTAIASLEDISQIRASIEKSASELKSSIDRMTEEGTVAMELLQEQVATYRVKLEEAEAIAARDALTGLRSRLCVESLIERFIESGIAFCVAIVDIDDFKNVNDEHGHLVGDELLQQFAAELVSACRSSDVTGRWGGDEFIIALECDIAEATSQIDRLRKWVCGSYTVAGKSGKQKLTVEASIGLAEHSPREPIKDLLARADAAMYANKSANRSSRANSKSRS
jgi:diguanylate cyclase (GGDEF)-like protein